MEMQSDTGNPLASVYCKPYLLTITYTNSADEVKSEDLIEIVKPISQCGVKGNPAGVTHQVLGSCSARMKECLQRSCLSMTGDVS